MESAKSCAYTLTSLACLALAYLCFYVIIYFACTWKNQGFATKRGAVHKFALIDVNFKNIRADKK